MLKTTSLQELYFENLYISPAFDFLYLRALHNKHFLVSVSVSVSTVSSFSLFLLFLLFLPLLVPFPISLFLWPRSFGCRCCCCCCCQGLRVLTTAEALRWLFLRHLQAGGGLAGKHGFGFCWALPKLKQDLYNSSWFQPGKAIRFWLNTSSPSPGLSCLADPSPSTMPLKKWKCQYLWYDLPTHLLIGSLQAIVVFVGCLVALVVGGLKVVNCKNGVSWDGRL